MWKQKPSKAWTGLLYEDSANENWLQLLEETKLKIFISPWHERDLKEDGTYKKEFFDLVNSLETRFMEAAKNTTLPDVPDYKKVLDFVKAVNARELSSQKIVEEIFEER